MMSGILPPPGGGGGAPPTTQASTPSETPNDNQGNTIKTEAEIELTPVTQVKFYKFYFWNEPLFKFIFRISQHREQPTISSRLIGQMPQIR